MALARSASGPGGLSINTGAANLFGGSSSQPPAPGGLFGSASAQTSQPAASGGLFGTAPSQPAQKPSLFGTSTAASTASQPQQTGGLFGTAGATGTPQPQPAAGLFGSTTTATSQPQQMGGLFGASTAAKPGGLFGSATPAQQPQQTGGLFGSTLTAQPQQPGTALGGGIAQATPAGAPSLFGATGQQAAPLLQQPQQQQPAAGGLFGASTAARPAVGGMFASLGQPQQAQPASTSLFGARPASGLFASQLPMGQSVAGPGLTMGQSTNQGQQQGQVVPGVRIDLSNVKGTTRFNDLTEALQAEIVRCDNMIQACMGQKNQVDAFMPAHGEALEAIPDDVRFVGRKYDGVAAALGADAQTIQGLRDVVKVDADNARLSFKAVDNLKLPPQYHTSGLWSTRQQEGGGPENGEASADLINFFSKTGDEMDEQLKKFQRNLGEIEMHMRGVESNLLEQLQRVASTRNGSQAGGAGSGGGATADDRVAELATVLREFEESILKVAGVVGSSRETMTGLQLGGLMGGGSRNGLR